MDSGKEKGFVLYDEVNELIAEDFPSGREFEDLLTDLDSAGVEILEEPKLDFEKASKDEPDDFGDLELAQDVGDKTNDPVRMYLREMGTVPLLTREGEIELAKRNERGQWAVRKALSRSPLVIREIIQLGDDLQRGVTSVRDVLVLPEFVITDEDFSTQLNELLAQVS
jgi:RNA polymerase primary sigma factor